jgi:hypothetical protein
MNEVIVYQFTDEYMKYLQVKVVYQLNRTVIHAQAPLIQGRIANSNRC